MSAANATQLTTHKEHDVRAALVRKTGESIQAQNDLAAQIEANRELRRELADARRLAEAFKPFQANANELREIVMAILEGGPACDECDGTGGEPIREYERSFHSASEDEPDLVVVGHEDPAIAPCDTCFGTGIDIPSDARLRELL